MGTWDVVNAGQALVRAAIACLAADYAPEHAEADAQAEYAYDQLALAARELTRAVDGVPAEEQPPGWREKVQSTCCDGTGYADYAAVPCPAPDCPVRTGAVQ